MVTIHKFGATPLTCHAWSSDQSKVAISQNNQNIVIYKSGGKGWETESQLQQHDLRVTGIDWAPRTNRIVTCSEDRNAYVWVKDGEAWKHTLVVLRINRAATCVRWSPDENKFAVGSGAKVISVCFYEKEYDFWVAKHIKKPIKSTVTTVDWHPNNILLAAGSTDFKVRIFSGYLKEIEAKPTPTEWGAKMTFGNMMAEFTNSPDGGGWVHDLSFSLDGSKVAWVGHGSSVSVADAGNGMRIAKLKTCLLPFKSVIWVSQSTLIVAGHDYVPIVFSLCSEGNLVEGDRLEEDKKAFLGTLSNARQMFQNMDILGQSDSGTRINTTHENQVRLIHEKQYSIFFALFLKCL